MDEEPIGQERRSIGRLKKFDLENTANLVRNRGAKQISKNVIKLVFSFTKNHKYVQLEP